MYWNKFFRMYKMQTAILIFLISFGIFHWIQPAFSYLPDGSFRPFGVGFRHKTVVPAWVVAIILAILSYLIVLGIIQMR